MTVVVLTTGGTIASMPARDGAVVTALSGDDLVAAVPGLRDEGRLEVREVLRIGGYLITAEQMLTVARAARHAAGQEGVAGVVVTHGTDTMEETAYLTDLIHDADAPIVFTGAQRHAGSAHSDGPANLLDAVRIARSAEARGLGVVLALEGRIDGAREVTKLDTYALRAFGTFGPGQLGWVGADGIRIPGRRVRPATLAGADALEPDVALVKLVAGIDGTFVDAAHRAGARGIVLECFGLGNANLAVVEATRRVVQQGVVVVVVSRCPAGSVAPVYGNGGGCDLEAAGAIFGGDLSGQKARVLLMAALAAGAGRPDDVRRLMQPHFAL
jgi:L-asparaginase